MDKSLDEIIKTKSSNRRRPRRGAGAKATATGAKQTTVVAAAAKAAKSKPAPPAVTQIAEKIIVSNLPVDVNETQLRELFVTTVGPVRNINLHYDAGGRWNGSATIHFQRKGDGTSAYNQYNNRLIDGKRPMKIEVIVDPSSVPPAASLVHRVTPATNTTKSSAPTEGVQRTSSRGRGRRTRGGRSKRPQKSAADLDAEMEDYTASNAPAATTAAPAAAAA